jgi:phosphatidylglycerophosphatase A
MSPLDRVAVLIATWFGCGYFPVGPGTAGSLAALLLAMAAHWWLGWNAPLFALMAVLFTVPGIWAAGVTEARAGREDPGTVVVDEVVGQWLTLAGATTLNWKSWLAAFALFRLFDIVKPYPARRLEALHGGVGIIADDLMAGVYAALVLYIAGCFNLY